MKTPNHHINEFAPDYTTVAASLDRLSEILTFTATPGWHFHNVSPMNAHACAFVFFDPDRNVWRVYHYSHSPVAAMRRALAMV